MMPGRPNRNVGVARECFPKPRPLVSVRILHGFVLTSVVAGSLAVSPACAQSPEIIDKAAKDSIRALGLQTELPRPPPPRTSRPIRLQIPTEMVWAVLICAALILLYAMRDWLPFWRRAAGGDWSEPDAETEARAPHAAADALSAADQLSREGRFVEAMHMLLLQSLAEIRQRLATPFADSLTSREILRAARLPAQGRSSLRELVAAVEWTHFGGHPARLADYTACRRSFESLRHALGGGHA